jgi:hypothetical protein
MEDRRASVSRNSDEGPQRPPALDRRALVAARAAQARAMFGGETPMSGAPLSSDPYAMLVSSPSPSQTPTPTRGSA